MNYSSPAGKDDTDILNQETLGGGWTNPSEKYYREIGNLPQIGMNIKNVWVATT